jgi:hypothetical protein
VRRAAVLLGALACLAGCGTRPAPIPAEDLMVSVRLGTDVAHPGLGFPLTVVRVWSRKLEPSPWDDGLLSPLVLRRARVTRREDAGYVEETRRFLAYAFTLKDVTIPPVPFVGRPLAGGAPRIVSADPLRLHVVPVLDPDAPGRPEGPGPWPRHPGGGLPWEVVAAALVLLAGGLGLVARARRAARRAAGEPAADPSLAALAALRAHLPAGPGALEADVAAVADLVRVRAGTLAGLPGRRRTTQELCAGLADAPVLAAPLAVALAPCDRVKFGGVAASAELRARALDAAEIFLRKAADREAP